MWCSTHYFSLRSYVKQIWIFNVRCSTHYLSTSFMFILQFEHILKMDHSVKLHGLKQGESPPTNVARKRFLASVNPHVSNQLTRTFPRFAAVLANMSTYWPLLDFCALGSKTFSIWGKDMKDLFIEYIAVIASLYQERSRSTLNSTLNYVHMSIKAISMRQIR